MRHKENNNNQKNLLLDRCTMQTKKNRNKFITLYIIGERQEIEPDEKNDGGVETKSPTWITILNLRDHWIIKEMSLYNAKDSGNGSVWWTRGSRDVISNEDISAADRKIWEDIIPE